MRQGRTQNVPKLEGAPYKQTPEGTILKRIDHLIRQEHIHLGGLERLATNGLPDVRMDARQCKRGLGLLAKQAAALPRDSVVDLDVNEGVVDWGPVRLVSPRSKRAGSVCDLETRQDGRFLGLLCCISFGHVG